MTKEVIVIGGGLAGSEAAYQIAKRGIKVKLYEMRPAKQTPVHKTGKLAELVCSNSLKSVDLYNASGLLKFEMETLDSLIIRAAKEAKINEGKALVVDRNIFSDIITRTIEEHPNVEIIREEVKEIPRDRIVIVATGPLTSDDLAKDIQRLTGEDYLAFYDAVSPIVDGETLNYDKLFWADRHGRDPYAYLNAPFTQEEYYRFVEELLNAEKYEIKEFEQNPKFFEGCLPIEEMARRGPDTLRFGPMNPRGLVDPRTGKEPFAVVQLRPENRDRTAFSLVGFQTQLKWGEQKRVFRLIPGLENAEFLRYGVIHRNTFIKSPKVLRATLQMREHPNIFFAGQITGVEGYVASSASGLIAGINASRLVRGKEPIAPPEETMMGALLHYIENADPEHFQPMPPQFGLFENIPPHLKGRKRREYMIERAVRAIREFAEKLEL